MSDTSRILTLLYNMRQFFKVNKLDEVTGIKLSRKDLDDAVKPDRIVVGSGTSKITVSDTEPVNPQEGDIWIDTTGL